MSTVAPSFTKTKTSSPLPDVQFNVAESDPNEVVLYEDACVVGAVQPEGITGATPKPTGPSPEGFVLKVLNLELGSVQPSVSPVVIPSFNSMF